MINRLEAAARAVVERWEQGDLAEVVRELADVLKQVDDHRIAYAEDIEAARDRTGHREDLEIDDDAFFSIADEGVWVSGWCWVSKPSEADGEEN